MADDTGGRLVDSVAQCAEALVELLGDRATAERLAAAGRERVREHFLLPRLLLNELSLMLDIARSRSSPPSTTPASRDPVCGMAVDQHEPELTAVRRRDPFRAGRASGRGARRAHPRRAAP